MMPDEAYWEKHGSFLALTLTRMKDTPSDVNEFERSSNL
jgi:hypothetical protein